MDGFSSDPPLAVLARRDIFLPFEVRGHKTDFCYAMKCADVELDAKAGFRKCSWVSSEVDRVDAFQ